MERLKDRTRQRQRISMPRNSSKPQLRILILAAMLLMFSGCGGGNSSGPAPPKTDVFSLVLDPQPIAGEGPRPFMAKFPAQIGSLIGNIKSLKNDNSFRMGLLKAGHSTGECFSNSSATVVLNPGATTVPQDLMQIFGSPNPVFSTSSPVTIVACVEGGANPGVVRVTVTYTH